MTAKKLSQEIINQIHELDPNFQGDVAGLLRARYEKKIEDYAKQKSIEFGEFVRKDCWMWMGVVPDNWVKAIPESDKEPCHYEYATTDELYTKFKEEAK